MTTKHLLPIALAVLLSGCAAERSVPVATETVTRTAPRSTAVPAAPSSPPVTVTVTAPPPQSPEPSGVPTPCTDGELAVSNKPVESQGPEYRVVLLFENTSSHRCTLTGYPGVDIVNQTGPVVHAERRPQNAAPHLTLEPGDVATADLQSRDVHPVNSGDVCPHWGSVVVIAPNTFQPHTLDIGMPMCSPLISSVT
ncbi:DUF4232 domain-containing protein [Mycobacterium sp. Y57]|uniref:DUF4232 domain-containing protein n=1 Tax=Mycolicibacterium xanthum TaxID=2796469 RepID=UPI001C85F25A|nr:DUF4232 domain-containing protein [Mycolicibacterium xanthum]MBX7435123.1 DUF4232 domain-containing protein [Mycolicibacterium xanthum]